MRVEELGPAIGLLLADTAGTNDDDTEIVGDAELDADGVGVAATTGERAGGELICRAESLALEPIATAQAAEKDCVTAASWDALEKVELSNSPMLVATATAAAASTPPTTMFNEADTPLPVPDGRRRRGVDFLAMPSCRASELIESRRERVTATAPDASHAIVFMGLSGETSSVPELSMRETMLVAERGAPEARAIAARNWHPKSADTLFAVPLPRLTENLTEV